MAQIKQTAGRDQLGAFAPEFAHFNDDVLFGENWNNRDIDLKTRSIIVISVFMGRGLVDDSLKYHLQTAKQNGVTKKEIAAIITHAAFYAGWPVAWAVFNLAKTIWTEEAVATGDAALAEYAKTLFFPVGQPNDAYAKYFSGKSWLAPVSTAQVPVFNVTFEPGCRNNWHVHHATTGGGQMLIGVGGRGFYQEEGKDPVEIRPGTVINIPAGVKHWHGAAPDSYFSHLAIPVPGEETSDEWLEPVSEEEYKRVW